MINDFLLVYYEHEHKNKYFFQKLFRIMERQLEYWYPDAHIHVITNKRFSNTNRMTCYCDPAMPTNWSAKLGIYDFLDRPAMYLDLDILITRPFTEEHLKSDYPFRMYWIVKPQVASFKHPHYNAAVVWIPKPDKVLAEQIKELHTKHEFNKPPWNMNDEFAVSLLIAQNHWHQEIPHDVNVPRHLVKDNKAQTIHYGLETKYSHFLPDVKKIILPSYL